MKVVVVCNGTDYSVDKIKAYCNDAEYVICADGALKILNEAGVRPGVILGDLDSVDSSLLARYDGVPVEKHPPEKDHTDSELGILKAYDLGATSIVLLAATGDYTDHSLANMLNLSRYYRPGTELKLVTSNCEIFPVESEVAIKHRAGRRISLFPVGEVKGLLMQGFKYHFENADISPLDYSVSNVIVDHQAHISVKSGSVICMLFDEGFD